MTVPAFRQRSRDMLSNEVESIPIETPRGFNVVRVLEGDPPEPPQMDVERWLIGGSPNMLSGQGGAGKGLLGVATMLSTATGRSLGGTLGVNRDGPVVAHVPEDGQAVMRMRMDAFMNGHGFSASERQIARERIVMVDEMETVDITTQARRLAQTVKDVEAVLCLLDPIGNMLGGKSGNQDDVADPAMEALRREVCRATGATVLASHHTRKPGKDDASNGPSQHDTRGSGGWVNGCRLVHAVSSKGSRISTVVIKANGIPIGLRHDFDLHFVVDPTNEMHWLECRLTDANAGATSQSLTPGVGRAINENERRALLAVDNRLEPGRRVSWSEWVKTSGLKDETLKSIKTRLIGARMIDPFEAGAHRNGGKLYSYAINDRGIAALETGWTADVKGERVR